MKNYDVDQHVKGKSIFVDDMNLPSNTLYAEIISSSIAHGKIISVDFAEVINSDGVEGIITFEDIEGENQIGGMIKDEVLLAESEVHYVGQPIAVVAADSKLNARRAASKVKIEYEKLKPIMDPREAYLKGSLIAPPVIFELGDVDSSWDVCDYIEEGTVESGGQEHLYLETQAAAVLPMEGGKYKVYSSTQSPTATQRVTAAILGVSMHNVEVDVLRLGGGFGGKEDQASPYAAMAALAVSKFKKPVKLVLDRQTDLKITGKRHPYSSDFKIGFNKEGKIIAYEVIYFQNSGAAADLSMAILERTLFHSTNSYFIPNVKATGIPCKTNLPPNTAFRGFGGPQAMFVIESAIKTVADKLGVVPHIIQEKNLLNEGDEFPYGQKARNCNARKCWHDAKIKFNHEQRTMSIMQFNLENKYFKKGIALMPICFGISFTSTFMNQASALVHVYTDGSIGISTAAVEMGQGVNTKIRQVAAVIFNVDISRVRIESTNTTRNANTSPTAASSAADLNGKATENACLVIKDRLLQSASKIMNVEKTKIELKNEAVYIENEKVLTWNELINRSYLNRVNLSSHSHYATPNIYFDRTIYKGDAFAYHVYGTAIIESTLDVIRGTYKINSVKAVHDFGESFSNKIDLGQAEGAIIQGIGWMTMEEIIHDVNGRLLSNALSTYKIPDVHFTPEEFEVHFLENSKNPMGIFNSKAIGEPPFMYGIAAYFSILDAINAHRPVAKFEYKAPMTPERALVELEKNRLTKTKTQKQND